MSDEGIEILKKELPRCVINPEFFEVKLPYLFTKIVGASGLDVSNMRPSFNYDEIKKIVHLPITYLQ